MMLGDAGLPDLALLLDLDMNADLDTLLVRHHGTEDGGLDFDAGFLSNVDPLDIPDSRGPDVGV
jgi:hypothetical protein